LNLILLFVPPEIHTNRISREDVRYVYSSLNILLFSYKFPTLDLQRIQIYGAMEGSSKNGGGT
jgi:hypothetical protein